jgi:hypothetical protein
MQLYGVVALAPSVARLKNLGALEDRATAIQELCAINRHALMMDVQPRLPPGPPSLTCAMNLGHGQWWGPEQWSKNERGCALVQAPPCNQRLAWTSIIAPTIAQLAACRRHVLTLWAGQMLTAKVLFLRWSEDDAAAYLKHIEVVRMLRSREEWKLELGWLETQGVAIPEALRPLCCTE